jgi:cytochrome P450
MMPAPEQPSPLISADADVLTALFSPAGRDDPQAVLRAADVPGCRYAVVNAVLHDRRFAPPTLPASPDLMFQTLMRWMPRVDGDRHRRLRTRFGGLFTARRVQNFRLMVSARVIGLSTLFRRIPGLVTGQPIWRGSAPLRQIESLPCRSRPEAD